jgi:AraC family transcriptional regulator
VTPRPAAAPVPRAGLTDRQWTAVYDLVEACLGEPVPLRAMAGAAGLSVSQFTRQFKTRTGLTPHQFLVQRRVDAACVLLRDTALPIADVAQRCGFSHQEHLTRVLKAHLRTTPAAIRRARFVQ